MTDIYGDTNFYQNLCRIVDLVNKTTLAITNTNILFFYENIFKDTTNTSLSYKLCKTTYSNSNKSNQFILAILFYFLLNLMSFYDDTLKIFMRLK